MADSSYTNVFPRFQGEKKMALVIKSIGKGQEALFERSKDGNLEMRIYSSNGRDYYSLFISGFRAKQLGIDLMNAFKDQLDDEYKGSLT